MTRERFRYIAVLIGLIIQIVGGVLGFGFAPQAVFANIGGSALAQLCLRLAVYSNLSMALLVLLIIRYAAQSRLLRYVAAAGALYNLLAGFDSLRTAFGCTGVVLADPVFGPAVIHSLLFILLLAAALLPEEKTQAAE